MRGLNPLTGRPGPAPDAPRDGDRKQARRRINVEVRDGRRPHPNDLPCVDCGHVWRECVGNRHEYDHYLGYASEHHYDVQSVCNICHNNREKRRRLQARLDHGMKWCGKCKVEHPLEHFGVSRRNTDGLMANCRKSESDRSKAKWAKEKERRSNAAHVD